MAQAPIIFTGPLPEQGSQWCAVCTALVKGWILQEEQVKEVIQRSMDPGAPMQRVQIVEGVRRIPEKFELQRAVTTGLVILPVNVNGQNQLVPVPAPVCYSHCNGLILSDTGILPASAADMPRDPTRGGVVLGQRRG
jgi:hypothetical protein